MDFLKLLLYIGLILTVITAYTTEESENSSDGVIQDPLPYNVTLIHSNIRLIPYIEENNVGFHGEYNVSIKIQIAMHHIGVYLVDMEIEESATTLISDDNGAIYKPTNYTYNYTPLLLLFTFDEELSPGFYSLYMKFGGISALNKVNSLQTSYITNEGGRLWTAIMAVPLVAVTGLKFPCWGKQEFKHTIDISIKHHRTFKAVSHMPIRAQNTEKDDMVWTHFNTTPSMSICKMMVALTDFVLVSNANETINMWCSSYLTSHVKYAQNVAEKVKEYMVQYASISEKLPKIDQVVIPGFRLSGLTSLGIIFYSESDIAYNDTTDPTYLQIKVTKLVAHEVSHQWFGGLVFPSQMTQRWLSEGLSSFFEMYISDKIFPNWRITDLNVVHTLQRCLSEDTGLTMSPINQVIHDSEGSSKYDVLEEDLFEFSSDYDKALVVLRMLQHAVTDEVFRNGILTYLNTYQFNSATSDDLWSAMDGILKVSAPHKDFEVKEAMDTWMNQRHYPLVIVTRDYETGETFISQDDFRLSDIESGPAKKWWVPVTFATQTNPNFNNTIPYSWLRPSRAHLYMIQVDPNDWIIVNVQQVGYYRVKYDAGNWQKIIQYLNSKKYTKIHVLNRAQIIDDAFVLMTRGLSLDLNTFFDLMTYLSRETDYIAWYPVFRNLAKMLKYFPLSESEYFKSHMAEIFNRPLRNIGYEEKSNENDFTKLRRLKITKWACLVGNLECKRMANAKLNYYLADIKNHKLSYWWQRWTYCSGLMAANRTTWDRIMDLYMQKRNKIFLEFLACSEDSDIIINYLNIISSNNSTIPEQDRIFALKHIIIKHARNNQVLDYILGNFETVKPISVIAAALLEDIISNVYTEAQLEKIKSNVKNGMHQEILTTIQPVIESRLVALRNLIESFSAWFMKEEKQA